MPHVSVKMVDGHSQDEKRDLAARIEAAVIAALGSAPGEISVAIEEFAKADWMDAVYAPDIAGREQTLVKRPGYGPLA